MNRRLSCLFVLVPLFLSCAIVLAAGNIAGVAAAPAEMQTISLDKTYNWKVTSAMAAGQNPNRGLVEFVKALEQRSKGKIKITLYEGTLGSPNDAWEMVKGNAVQFAFTTDMYNVGRMPILSMVGLPFEIPDQMAAWETANEWLKAGYLKELTDNFKVLYFQSSNALTFFFRKKKVTTVDDFKGMKIRCGGNVQCQSTAALGANGVSLPGGEIYMALQTGVIDGTISGIDVALDRKMYEPAKFALDKALYFGIFVFVMNKETWNSLPPDLQKFIDQTAQEINTAEMHKRVAEESSLWSAYGKNCEVYTIPNAEVAKWRQAAAGVSDKYVKETAAKGYPAKEALELMRKVAAGSKK